MARTSAGVFPAARNAAIPVSLLLFDSLSMEFREVKIPRDPNCPLCGDNPTIHELIDYEAFCGAPVTTLG